MVPTSKEPSIKKTWQAVSAAVFVLEEIARRPGMEVMKLQLLDREVPSADAQLGETGLGQDGESSDDDEEEDDVSDEKIAAFIRRRSSKDKDVAKDTLYFIISAVTAVKSVAAEAVRILSAKQA